MVRPLQHPVILGAALMVLMVPTHLAARDASAPEAIGEYEPVSLDKLLPADTEFEMVSLDQLLETADRKAPVLRRAAARLNKAGARVEGTDVLTIHDPELQTGVERFPFGEFSYGEARIGVFQRFTIGGEQKMRLEAARAHRKVVVQKLEETHWKVHARLHRLYNLALVDVKQLRLSSRVRRFFEDLLAIARQRLEAGETSNIAMQLAKVELARAKQNVVQAQSALVSRLHKLEEVSGWSQPPLPVPADSLPEVSNEIEADEIRERALESFPPIETRKAAVQAARVQHEAEKRQGVPDPGIGLAYKHKSPNAGPSSGGLVVQLSFPLPFWNANRFGRMVSAAEIRVSKTKLEALRDELGPRIVDAIQNFESAARQVEIFQQRVVPAFQRESKLLRQGYRAGEFDITEVTVAEQRLLSTRRRALEALTEYFEATAEIERLTGREFWPTRNNADNRGGTP